MLNVKRTTRILLVFSHQDQLALFRNLLNNVLPHNECVVCENFAEAGNHIKNSNESLDIIIVDLLNNSEPALHSLKNFFKIFREIPVIGFCENANSNRFTNALIHKMSGVLFKNELNAAILVNAIQSAIRINELTVRLVESEKLYRDFVDFSPHPMCVYDAVSLKFLDVNDAAVQQYGFNRNEFMLKKMLELFYPSDLETLTNAMDDIKNGKQKFLAGNYRHVKKNGEIIQVELQGYHVMYKNKKAQLMVISDITERLNYLNTIEQQYSRLLEIAWIQSHVVRVPLARIMGLIDVLKNYTVHEIEKSEIIDHLVDSARELDQLIRNISDKTE